MCLHTCGRCVYVAARTRASTASDSRGNYSCQWREPESIYAHHDAIVQWSEFARFVCCLDIMAHLCNLALHLWAMFCVCSIHIHSHPHTYLYVSALVCACCTRIALICAVFPLGLARGHRVTHRTRSSVWSGFSTEPTHTAYKCSERGCTFYSRIRARGFYFQAFDIILLNSELHASTHTHWEHPIMFAFRGALANNANSKTRSKPPLPRPGSRRDS